MKKIILFNNITYLYLLLIYSIFSSVQTLYCAIPRVAQQLFDRVDNITDRELSQTEAILKVPKIRDQVASIKNLSKYQNIIEQVLNNGAQFAPTHYELFHAQHWIWQLYQDVFTKLYFATHKTIPENSKNFYFMRYSLNDPYYNLYKDVQAFLLYQLDKYGMIDDMTLVKGHLLSTNLALFANLNYIGESTWYYFTESKSWFKPDKKIMTDILSLFGIPESFADEFLALIPLLKTREGRLFQIFIPRELIDSLAYLAWVRGIPYDTELIKTIVQRRLVKKHRPKIKTLVEEYQQGWKKKEKSAVAMINHLKKMVQEATFAPSKFLNVYKKSPEKIPFFDTTQARVLITNDGLLNPESDIKIIRYSTMTKEQESAYEQKLDELVTRALAEKKTSVATPVAATP